MPREKTVRVSQIWPETIREAVRERVGGRGMTAFTLAAVEAKLGTHDEHQEDSRELNEVKFLVQRLADAIATGGDYEDRESTLREIDLPPWVDTTGWPDDLVRAINPEESTPEPVVLDGPSGLSVDDDDQADEDEDLHRPMALTRPKVSPEPEPPAIGDPGTVRSEAPQSSSHDDLLARVRAKAMEKGVDISGVDLVPASTVEKPPAETAPVETPEEPEAPSEPAPSLEVQPDAATPLPENTCPDCGHELVGGECWECM